MTMVFGEVLSSMSIYLSKMLQKFIHHVQTLSTIMGGTGRKELFQHQLSKQGAWCFYMTEGGTPMLIT